MVRRPFQVRERTRRTLDQRLAIRFPAVAALGGRLLARLPPGSRLRVRSAQIAIEAYNRRDLLAASVAFHPDLEYYPYREFVEAGLAEPCYHGPEGYRAYITATYDVWGSDVLLKPTEVIDFGDRFVLLADMPMRAQASGIALAQTYATVATLKDGRVITQRTSSTRPKRSKPRGCPHSLDAVESEPFQVVRSLPAGGELVIDGEIAGQGPPVVLLHGLSATRRNVVQGSRHLLKRAYRLIAYDARGHGASSPAPDYTYPGLIEDLEAVLAELGVERVALVGSSMGAATGMAFAMRHPDRAAAVVQITPAYNGEARTGNVDDGAWDAMASGLENGGVDAFVEVAQPGGAGEGWKEIAREAIRQRMERHEHPLEVAQALRQMPRSAAWDGLEALREVETPVLIVASRDEMDNLHPLAIAEEYARLLPNAELVVEEKGKSPLAWQGARLSHAIADFFERVGYPGEAPS